MLDVGGWLLGPERFQFQHPVESGSFVFDRHFTPGRSEPEYVDLHRPGAGGQIAERVLARVVRGGDELLLALRGRDGCAGDGESA